MSYFPALLSALLRRDLPAPAPTAPLHLMYAGRTVRPASMGLLVQHWHHCPVHGTQLVSVLEPGCRCVP